jgi:hypothetical protein
MNQIKENFEKSLQEIFSGIETTETFIKSSGIENVPVDDFLKLIEIGKKAIQRAIAAEEKLRYIVHYSHFADMVSGDDLEMALYDAEKYLGMLDEPQKS